MTAVDPYASVWGPETWANVRSLLERCQMAAKAAGTQLFLDSGTLLGYVRERTILAWDDDLDFSLMDEDLLPVLKQELLRVGLHTVDGSECEELAGSVKIFDPLFAPVSAYGFDYSYPFADVFLFRREDDQLISRSPYFSYTFSQSTYFPVKEVSFVGVRCHVPNDPLAVLHKQFRAWHRREVSSWWDHWNERERTNVTERAIETDATGLKIDLPEKVLALIRSGEDPYWHGHHPALTGGR